MQTQGLTEVVASLIRRGLRLTVADRALDMVLDAGKARAGRRHDPGPPGEGDCVHVSIKGELHVLGCQGCPQVVIHCSLWRAAARIGGGKRRLCGGRQS